jgi:hypothetical protein
VDVRGDPALGDVAPADRADPDADGTNRCGGDEPYASAIVFLFLGGFLIAIAMEKWNLHRRIALLVLRRVGVSSRPASCSG